MTVVTVVLPGAECGHPGEPAGGSLASSEILFYPGEEVTFTCQPGHLLTGPDRRHCREDGTWSDSLPSCSEYQSTSHHSHHITYSFPWGENIVTKREGFI